MLTIRLALLNPLVGGIAGCAMPKTSLAQENSQLAVGASDDNTRAITAPKIDFGRLGAAKKVINNSLVSLTRDLVALRKA